MLRGLRLLPGHPLRLIDAVRLSADGPRIFWLARGPGAGPAPSPSRSPAARPDRITHRLVSSTGQEKRNATGGFK